jgi:hypothetical protein
LPRTEADTQASVAWSRWEAIQQGVYLDPEIEFDAVLIAMKKTHDQKSQGYGTEDESLQNFFDIARQMNLTPLQACETLLAKHQSALKQWFAGLFPVHVPTSDDAFLDRAVYAVISKVLYDREKRA